MDSGYRFPVIFPSYTGMNRNRRGIMNVMFTHFPVVHGDE